MVLDLRHRWADGTTQLLFEPVELLERLAALTPRPRINLLPYDGVLGARSAWRSRLQAREPETAIAGGRGTTAVESSSRPAASIPPRTNSLWAELMQRSFGFDVLACPRCGDRLELIALIEDPKAIGRILRHLGVPTGRPTRSFDRCVRRRDDPRRAWGNPRCAGGRTGPYKGHSVNQARENSVNRSYRPGLDRGQHLPRPVRRAVVDDDDFDRQINGTHPDLCTVDCD